MIKNAIISLGLGVLLASCGGSSSSDDPTPVPEDQTPEEPAGPVNYGEHTVYLRGDLNDWVSEEANIMTLDEETNCYGLTTLVPAANHAADKLAPNQEPTEHKFKIASEDWNAVNIGGSAVTGTSLINRETNLVELETDIVTTARIRLPGDTVEEINALPDPKELLLSAVEEAERTFTLCFPDNDPNAPTLTVK